jgi:hypothetical protein
MAGAAVSSVEYIEPRDTREALRPVVRMELDSDVPLGELIRALSASGLALSTLHGGRQLIHRAPKEAA